MTLSRRGGERGGHTATVNSLFKDVDPTAIAIPVVAPPGHVAGRALQAAGISLSARALSTARVDLSRHPPRAPFCNRQYVLTSKEPAGGLPCRRCSLHCAQTTSLNERAAVGLTPGASTARAVPQLTDGLGRPWPTSSKCCRRRPSCRCPSRSLTRRGRPAPRPWPRFRRSCPALSAARMTYSRRPVRGPPPPLLRHRACTRRRTLTVPRFVKCRPAAGQGHGRLQRKRDGQGGGDAGDVPGKGGRGVGSPVRLTRVGWQLTRRPALPPPSRLTAAGAAAFAAALRDP